MDFDLSALTADERRTAVDSFDARYGEMDEALWCLSKHCRTPLMAGEGSPVVEALIWTAKSWWAVQGVALETRPLMAEALAELEWSTDLFEPVPALPRDADTKAVELVSMVVERTKSRERSESFGARRRYYSLASKALHWLLPWRVPVYDSYVRKAARVPTSWDHPEAYRRIVRVTFEAVRDLTETDPSWMGSAEPRSPLRAIDKCLWWLGGGDAETARVVDNPWKVIDDLDLERC